MEQAQSIQATPTYSTLAIFSVAFGVLAWTLLPIVGLLMSTFSIFSFILMPLAGSTIASICAQVAQRQIRRSDGALRGEGIAKAARIMAYTQYALVALVFAFAFVQIFVLKRGSMSLY